TWKAIQSTASRTAVSQRGRRPRPRMAASIWSAATNSPPQDNATSSLSFIPEAPLPFQIQPAHPGVAGAADAELGAVAHPHLVAGDAADILHVDHRAAPDADKAVFKQVPR